MGPGEILVSATQNDDFVNADVRLFNFDIDVAGPLKSEHIEFLRSQVIPAIQANHDASIVLIGSASRSGPEAHNFGLSRRRAEEVQRALGPINSQILVTFGRGAPISGPHEDKHDRAVFMFLSFPTTIAAADFYTDDWSRHLHDQDIVGVAVPRPASTNFLNLQVTLTGAPRFFSIGGSASVNLVPAEITLRARGKRSGRFIDRQTWQLRLAPQLAQPATPSQSFYRLSDTVDGMGFADKSGQSSYAEVSRTDKEIFQVVGWETRGSAQQDKPGAYSPDAQMLMRAGGYATILLGVGYLLDNPTSPSRSWVATCLIRSPATAFCYSGYAGSGSNGDCSSSKGEFRVSPDDLQLDWGPPFSMELLILAAPYLLAMTFQGGIAAGGPGARWAKLVRGRSHSGSVTAIVGYADEAPKSDVLASIVDRMAHRLANGLNGYDLVDTWLNINANDWNKNTWNAVGIDRRGYFRIGEEKATVFDSEFFWHPGFPYTYKPVTIGPAPILEIKSVR